MAYHDLSELNAMAMGDSEFVQKMIGVFLESTEKSLNQLLEAFEKGDYDKVATLAHKIKPSIDMMGVKDLYEPVRTLEKEVRLSGEQLESTVEQLNEVLTKVFEELK